MGTGGKRLSGILIHVLLYGVMGIYFVILFLLLFGKRAVGTFQSVNLVPFQEIGAYLFGDNMAVRAFGLGNVLGNIMIFIPLGIYVSLLHRRGKIVVNAILVMAISGAAEILQYIFRVGASDIDDVLLNTLGGLIGAAVFYALNRLFKNNVEKAVAFLALAGAMALIVLLFMMNGGNGRFPRLR